MHVSRTATSCNRVLSTQGGALRSLSATYRFQSPLHTFRLRGAKVAAAAEGAEDCNRSNPSSGTFLLVGYVLCPMVLAYIPTPLYTHMSTAVPDAMVETRRIGFLGAGQMAEALARGFIAKGVVTADRISATDPATARKDLFRSFGASGYDTALEVCADTLLMTPSANHTLSALPAVLLSHHTHANTRTLRHNYPSPHLHPQNINILCVAVVVGQVAKNSDVLIVAVKPQYVSQVLQEVKPVLGPNAIIVSIAAGITVEK